MTIATRPDSVLSGRICADEACQRLAFAVEQTADGVCITDSSGVIEYVNAAFQRLMGFSREQMIGEKTSLFQSGEHDGAFYEQLWQTVLAGQVFRQVFVNRKADGSVVHLDQSITPLRDPSGTITHFVEVARDITVQVKSSAALRRVNDHLERQARSIAQSLHDEAGQLLTAAHIALAETGHDLPESGRRRVQEVRNHLDLIEEQLRRLSHELRPRILDDLGLVPAIEFLADGVAKRRGMSVAVEADGIDRLSPAIETAIYRSVQEALTNAGRHSRAAHVTIRLERKGDSLRCSIQDDGVGFDAASALAATGQNGIGLRGLIDRLEALGGTVEVVAAPGEGTALLMTVPVEA